MISLITDQSLSHLRQVNRPRSCLFNDSMISPYKTKHPQHSLLVSPSASQLLQQSRPQKVQKNVNQDQNQDSRYKLKLSMILFDKKNNYLKDQQNQQIIQKKSITKISATQFQNKCQDKLKRYDRHLIKPSNTQGKTSKKKLVLQKLKQKSLAALNNKLQMNSKQKVFEYTRKVMNQFQQEIIRQRQSWKKAMTNSQDLYQNQKKQHNLVNMKLQQQIKINQSLRNQIKRLQSNLLQIKKEKLKLQQNVPLYKQLEKHFSQAKDLKTIVNYQHVQQKCLKLLQEYRIRQQQDYNQFKILTQSIKVKNLQNQKKELQLKLNQVQNLLQRQIQKKRQLNRIQGYKKDLQQLKSFISRHLLQHCKKITSMGQNQLKNIDQIQVLGIIHTHLNDIMQKRVQHRQLQMNRKVYSNLKQLKNVMQSCIKDKDQQGRSITSTFELTNVLLRDANLLVKLVKKFKKQFKNNFN